MTDRTCSIEGCGLKSRARGFCKKHYKKWVRYGDPLAGVRNWDHDDVCSVEGCDNPHKARSWCNNHYQLWRKHGDPLHQFYGLDDVSYRTAHERVWKARGKASEHRCVDCGGQAAEWSYRARTGYSVNPADYDPRCVSCHRRYDASNAA